METAGDTADGKARVPRDGVSQYITCQRERALDARVLNSESIAVFRASYATTDCPDTHRVHRYPACVYLNVECVDLARGSCLHAPASFPLVCTFWLFNGYREFPRTHADKSKQARLARVPRLHGRRPTNFLPGGSTLSRCSGRGTTAGNFVDAAIFGNGKSEDTEWQLK